MRSPYGVINFSMQFIQPSLKKGMLGLRVHNAVSNDLVLMVHVKDAVMV